MATKDVKVQVKSQTVRVLISHDGLEPGETFRTAEDNIGWVLPRVAAGYLEFLAVEVPAVVEDQDPVQ